MIGQRTQADELVTEHRTRYDINGRTVAESDSDGNETRQIYDDAGQLVETIDPLGHSTYFTYSDEGEQETITDPEAYITRNVYDDQGRLDSTIQAEGVFDYTTSYTYNAEDQIKTTTAPDGTITCSEYDDTRRRTHTIQDCELGGLNISSDFTRLYVPGDVVYSRDLRGTVTINEYDAMGRVVLKRQDDGGFNYETTTHYDAKGNVDRTVAVEGNGGAPIADYSYDKINHFQTMSYATNGLTNRVEMDPLGRITHVKVQNGATDLVDYGYGHDDVGNRIYMQRNHQAGSLADVYVHDDLDQLTDVWYGANGNSPATLTSSTGQRAYDLDLLGNRLSVFNGTTADSYGPNDGERSSNNMNRYDSVNGQAFSYDLRGNLLSDGNHVYVYDILNRQTSVSDGVQGINTTQYVYDGQGYRIAKVAPNGDMTQFVYDTNQRVIEERDGSGLVLATYTYGNGIDEPLTMTRNGQTYFYHKDALGSVTELSGSNGMIVERYEYDVYGKATIYDANDLLLTESAIGNPYLFTARRLDIESGNYYYRARYYDAGLGRFLSTDPLGYEAGDYNLYRYVFNNPTNMSDPTGLYGDSGHFGATRDILKSVESNLTRDLGSDFNPSPKRESNLGYNKNSIFPRTNYHDQIPTFTVQVDYDFETTPFYGLKPWASVRNLIVPRLIEDFGEPARRTQATEYYHFQSFAVNDRRMKWALEQRNIIDFGRALHGFQDYFPHIASGYTFKLGRGGAYELLDKCTECFAGDEQEVYEMLERAYSNLGHVPFSAVEAQLGYTDKYDIDSPRDKRMARGTEYWLTLYLLDDSSVDPDWYYKEYLNTTADGWYQQNVNP